MITQLSNLKKLEEKINTEKKLKMELKDEKEIIPLLPPMDKNKFKFSIAIELDETLVHYCEEGDNYYAKVRFGDNKCYVEHRIFIEDLSEKQDLSKINRDLRKIIFVCHDYDFINAPKENIILLKEFLGEEDDREIVKLFCELKQFINNYDTNDEDNFDIRNSIPKIMERIYLNFENLDLLDDEEDEK